MLGHKTKIWDRGLRSEFGGDGQYNPDQLGPFGHDYSNIISVMNRFRDERVVFISNKGNAGDSLINLGAMMFLRRHGIDFELGSRNGTFRGRIVVCSGGGNLIEPYTGMKQVIERNAPVCQELVLLPHTARSYAGMFQELDSRVTLFAREQKSYDFLAGCAGHADVRLAHDMAFFVNPNDVMQWTASLSDIFLNRRTLRRHLIRALRLQMLRLYRLRHGNGIIRCFRTDMETTQSNLERLLAGDRSFDLSYWMASESMAEAANFLTVKSLLHCLAPFDTVETDRLHISISAGLLEKSVIMHDNSYGKNRDIYEHSVKRYFPKTEFCNSAGQN